MPCIAISTGYILLVMFLCEMARKLVAPLNDGLVKTALNEAIAAADLCGVCFELIISKSRLCTYKENLTSTLYFSRG